MPKDWNKDKYQTEDDVPWYKEKDCFFLQACDVNRPCPHCKYYIKKEE